MRKQLINQVQCLHCGQMFDVNTEDIEWEKLTDMGENENNKPMHDYGRFQTIKCSLCGKTNTILYKAIGELPTGNILHQEVLAVSGDLEITKILMEQQEHLRVINEQQRQVQKQLDGAMRIMMAQIEELGKRK